MKMLNTSIYENRINGSMNKCKCNFTGRYRYYHYDKLCNRNTENVCLCYILYCTVMLIYHTTYIRKKSALRLL